MTVRCVRRSNGQCDRVINGNIRIGNIHYDLRPAETDVTARDLFDVPYHAKRYVLSVHPHIRREVVLSNADAARVNTKNLEENLIDLPFRVPHGIYKINYFPPTITKLSSRNTRVFHTKRTTGENRYSGKLTT
ncbi:hypothetical protein ACJMK2_011313 [Sinanodonta woodiana]|uniref:Uncharacterized protein n=1 Tax=Sinanodonta woodiana TaxID=1069815 RepID=A0ABD3V743_SINWO